MGQVYYDLGFLSAVEVVECSASDLIGSYVGHTGPKTRGQLEKALGKVLFIDEAYRLAEGNFATEAINELVDLLTKPTFINKLIVILAGYDEDINHLISINPGLSSRFPEQIVFKSMVPRDCIAVLERSLREQEIQAPFLRLTDSDDYKSLVHIIKKLASLPSWGNARDIKTLANTIIGLVLRQQPSPDDDLVVSPADVINQARTMLEERRERSQKLPASTKDMSLPIRSAQPDTPSPSIGPPTTSHTRTTNESATEPSDRISEDVSLSPYHEPQIERDDGVSNEIWHQLQKDTQAAKAEAEALQKSIRAQETARIQAQQEEEKLAAKKAAIERAEALAKAEEIQELKRQQEQIRLREEAACRAKERALAEMERAREKQKKEQQVQAKLRHMGVCVAGFQWIKQSGGYRCAGGSHWVDDAQLGL